MSLARRVNGMAVFCSCCHPLQGGMCVAPIEQNEHMPVSETPKKIIRDLVTDKGACHSAIFLTAAGQFLSP